MGWIDDARQTSVADLACALGLQATRGNAVKPCPACNAEQRGSSDKRGPVGLRPDGQGWRCWACDASGDSPELAALVLHGKKLRDLDTSTQRKLRDQLAELGVCKPFDATSTNRKASGWKVKRAPLPRRASHVDSIPQGGGAFAWRDGITDDAEAALWSEDGAAVLAYLHGRGFPDDALRHWRVGAHFERRNGEIVAQYVAIPVVDVNGMPVNMRFRSVPGKCMRCSGSGCGKCKAGEVRKVYLRSPGRPTTLYGVHQLDRDTDGEVVIAEGELDVVALWAMGFKRNVVSGTAGAGAWADEWLDTLEPYRHFLIAYDTDEAGDKGAKSVADKLGRDRCSRAKLPELDAAECLRVGTTPEQLRAALDAAQPLISATIVRVSSFADELEQLINRPDELRGLTTGSPKLDEALGGWRPGLVVLTGDTAAGKTSFATWLGLEQARHGVPVMLTSFEQRPIGTVQKILRAEVGTDFTLVDPESRAAAMDRLGELPLYVLDHYGHLSSDDLREVISYSVRRRDVRWLLVDHLGFLVDGAEDERRAIEAVVREYATLAIQLGITICMICHPNNTSIAQQRRVKLGDLKGASAIRQDAHVGIVLERLMPGRAVKHPAAAVHVDKCRSEFGLQGSRVTMYYDPEACVYGDEWEQTPQGRAGLSGGFPIHPSA